jgi:hypothetical protein
LVDGIGGGALYSFVPTPEARQKLNANGWQLEAELRVASGDWITFFHGDGTRRFLPRFFLDASGDLLVSIEGSPTPPIQLASGVSATDYHQHRIEYDARSGQALYWFDGQWIAFWDGSASSLDGVYFGQGASAIDGTGYFRTLRITPTAEPLPVPMPALGPVGFAATAFGWIGAIGAARLRRVQALTSIG